MSPVAGAPCYKSTCAKSTQAQDVLQHPRTLSVVSPCPDGSTAATVNVTEPLETFPVEVSQRSSATVAPGLEPTLAAQGAGNSLLQQTFRNLKAISMSCFSSLFGLKNPINLPQTMFLSSSLHLHQVADPLNGRVLSGRVLQPRHH